MTVQVNLSNINNNLTTNWQKKLTLVFAFLKMSQNTIQEYVYKTKITCVISNNFDKNEIKNEI